MCKECSPTLQRVRNYISTRLIGHVQYLEAVLCTVGSLKDVSVEGLR